MLESHPQAFLDRSRVPGNMKSKGNIDVRSLNLYFFRAARANASVIGIFIEEKSPPKAAIFFRGGSKFFPR